MADRFFENSMPDFVQETTTRVKEGDSLMNLLSMPYSSLSQQLKRSALDLKETIVMETWGLSGQAFACFLLDRAHKLISAGEMHGGDSSYSLFKGIAGMAYLFLDMVEPSEARFPAYEL